MPRLLGALAVGCSLVVASPALGQGLNNSQLAQALFDEGLDLMDKHEYAKACPLLERSQRLEPGGGTLINLGLCYEGEGRLATAYTSLNQSLGLARSTGDHERETIALAHLDAIAPKLPKLRLSLAEPLSAVVVQIDEAMMGGDVLGVLTPIDPGAHHVRVSAQGRVAWQWEGSLAPGDKVELEVVLRPVPPPDPCAVDPNRCKPPPEPRPKKAYGPVTFALLGVSGAAVVTTVVTGVLALDAKSAFDAECLPSRNYCSDPTAGASDYDRMRNMAWASTISLGVAVVAGVVALVWPRHVVARPAAVAFAF